MPIQIESINEFSAALDEVEVLISSASACINERRQYAVYNKSALLLLAGKFENFAESVAEEYIYHVNSFNLATTAIPEVLRLQHTFAALSQVESLRHKEKAPSAVQLFTSLGDLWGSPKSFGALKVNCKFVYGKHGESELKKLFANIGIEDVFDLVRIYEQVDKDDPTSLVEVDFKGIFNSVTGLRNNILHQDATPSLTHVAIAEYVGLFKSFAGKLTDHLTSTLHSLSPV